LNWERREKKRYDRIAEQRERAATRHLRLKPDKELKNCVTLYQGRGGTGRESTSDRLSGKEKGIAACHFDEKLRALSLGERSSWKEPMKTKTQPCPKDDARTFSSLERC